ncbi:lipoate--protein ligase [Hornefia porci]|uniref:lipoate--protein ligase n=1 Tax=Hornefia porci TaxID=2652292 RepID=A0A1Q9JJP1_9FIRM|nr:lipoate--protein ligase [Hornefia porci]OLR56442.1 lipoate--protein ligase [Hornefia porci]
MIRRLLWMRTENTYPYRNLAMEEYLTMNVKDGECILYLWQNRHTVVIGKNQNCWKECKVSRLEEDGGYLVRRLSGGGAVFHDLGNLNFTFCVKAGDYDLNRQLEVILLAVRKLGMNAERTGRNDITVDGRKFSGNAFLRVGDQCYHHGTLMLNVNGADMAKYLNVDKKKLASKGVDSVRSRVASLIEFRPDITVEMMTEALISAFAEVYGLPCEEFRDESLPQNEIQKLTEKFESWEWKYGRKIPFEHEISDRFDWGDVQLQLHVNGGVIREINFYSDAMDQAAVSLFAEALTGCRYTEADMTGAIEAVRIPENAAPAEIARAMKKDITDLIREKI